jgi:hypothetical protein
VASVEVNLDDEGNGGINVRLDPGADEADVMERVRALLVAYGVRPNSAPMMKLGRRVATGSQDLGVEVRITPIKGGARVEVFGKSIRSFRIVPPTPTAIAQGVSDAWCQVVGKIPMEVVNVALDENDLLRVTLTNGTSEVVGRADLSKGWEPAVARAVGEALGLANRDMSVADKRLVSSSW